MSTLPWKGASALPVFLVLLGGSARAQEIAWLTDYDQARDAASRWNRPLLLCVGCQDCVGCRKLEAATWSDPGIAQQVRRDFVAFKVEAEVNPDLVQAIRVDTYPMVLFAAPDGKVLHYVRDFVEPAGMAQHIQQALTLLRDHNAQVARLGGPEPARTVASSPYRSEPAPASMVTAAPVPAAPYYWGTAAQPAAPAAYSSYPNYTSYYYPSPSYSYTPGRSC